MCIGKGYATSVVEVEGSCFLGLLGNQTRKVLLTIIGFVTYGKAVFKQKLPHTLQPIAQL
jgi:hypothetical protein